MKTVGAYEAKSHLSRLLEEVEAGERILITRHGSPVAMLVPARPEAQVDVRRVIGAMRELRKKANLGALSVREMIDEGRR